MKTPLFHWKKIKDNWDVVTILVIAFPTTVIGFLPEGLIPVRLEVEHYLSLFSAMFIAIAFSLLRSDPQALHDEITLSKQKLSELILSSRGRISPIRPDLYPGVWEGFIGNYFAVNAPFMLEEQSSEHLDQMVQKHVQRYESLAFNRATYIFFTHGDDRCYFSQAISRFSEFLKRVMAHSPRAADKIQVIVSDEQAPGLTVFIGQKQSLSTPGHPSDEYSYSILYINDKPLMSRKGMPKWAFVSQSEEFNTSLEDYVKDLVADHNSLSARDFIAQYG
ncbi:MAG: hypothetical protein ACX931_03335 [Saccharospirillum sp.]